MFSVFSCQNLIQFVDERVELLLILLNLDFLDEPVHSLCFLGGHRATRVGVESIIARGGAEGDISSEAKSVTCERSVLGQSSNSETPLALHHPSAT